MVMTEDVLLWLQILIAVMVVVVLYHILFIVVDVRKILNRFQDLTEQVESVMMKPISMADTILQCVMEMAEAQGTKKLKPKKKKKK